MKGFFSSGIEQMKTKNFYILVVFIAVTSVSIWLVSYPSPTFRNIMSSTQNNIRKLPKQIQMSTTPELEVESMYLEMLGFTDKKKVHSFKDEKVVIGSALLPGTMEEIKDFLRSAKKHVPATPIVLFDMGLSKSNILKVSKLCNDTTGCVVRTFVYDKYPSHIQDLSAKSYKPICIQRLLDEFGAVIWADTSEYFVTSKINNSITQAEKIGIMAWTIKDPTSSLTHPKMFDYFKTKPEKYFFHRAVQSSHLIIFNSQKIHTEVMLPWVKCALVEECINPTGAQNSWCSYRKPYFSYSGCHWYDMSALNVILGLVFEFNVSRYTCKDKIFISKLDIQILATANLTGVTHTASSSKHRVYI